MALPLEPQALPLATDSTGTVRVGGARVTLDSVVGSFLSGASAEEIAIRFPVLKLADIYSVIAYYLANQAEVDAYLLTRQQEALQIQQQMEAIFDPNGIRQRLLARKNS